MYAIVALLKHDPQIGGVMEYLVEFTRDIGTTS
jgi:hypothetical protein